MPMHPMSSKFLVIIESLVFHHWHVALMSRLMNGFPVKQIVNVDVFIVNRHFVQIPQLVVAVVLLIVAVPFVVIAMFYPVDCKQCNQVSCK